MMYLLLRNNKQSGPYSVEQLKSMGLKAYDLVWVEGKSAAWRYPCEIAELSAFAPVVEEQPFDRFFKRPDTTKANGLTSTAPAVAQPSVSSPVLVTTPRMTGEASGTAGRRIIYVNMPAGKAPAPQQEQPKNIPIDSTPNPPASTRTNAPERPQSTPLTTPIGAENLGQTEEEEALIGEILAQQNRRKKSRVIRPLLISFGIIALLAAGMFIGLSINKDGSLNFKDGWNLLPKVAQTTTAVPTSQLPPVTTQQPASTITTPVAQPPAEEPADTVAASTIASTAVTETPAPAKPVHAAGKIASNKPVVSSAAASTKDSAAVISVAHKESPVRSEERQDNNEKESVRTNIASMVSVGGNTYTVGTFGGISDLQLTVANRSPYPLDLVVVEVQYIQANKKIYKTENLYFRGIAAGSALMQEAPKSSRGIKVQYKIVMINSKESGLSYSGI